MREVRLSGEQGGPSPPQENAAADRGGDPRLPDSPQEGNPEYYQLVRSAVPGPGRPRGRVLRASGGASRAWEREARPPARPCGSGRGAGRPSDHAGRLRPRAPRPPGTGAFPGPTGLRSAVPSTWGGPQGIPSEGNFLKGPPEGAARPRAAATRRLAHLDRGPARVRPPPGGQAGAAEAPGP